MEHKIKTFLKFGSEKDIMDLYEHGTIFMNTINYYRNIEDKQLRGDSYEGVSRIINTLPGSFFAESINFRGNHQGVHIMQSYPSVCGNIYSLFCVSTKTIPRPFEYKMDERLSGFGTHCFMVYDNQKFPDLVRYQLRFLNHKFHEDFVTYYDRKAVNRAISVFEKPNEYEYQNEFRFYVHRNGLDPLKFRIGSLKDIGGVWTTEQIMTLQFSPSKKRGAVHYEIG